jgi:hypothetical protein
MKKSIYTLILVFMCAFSSVTHAASDYERQMYRALATMMALAKASSICEENKTHLFIPRRVIETAFIMDDKELIKAGVKAYNAYHEYIGDGKKAEDVQNVRSACSALARTVNNRTVGKSNQEIAEKYFPEFFERS